MIDFYETQPISTPKASMTNDFPTEDNPGGRFKYASVDFKMSKNTREISRQTYSILDWAGDWGGLLDAMFLLAETLVFPFSLNALHNRVAKMTFRKT